MIKTRISSLHILEVERSESKKSIRFLGKMSFNDDEPIVATENVSGQRPKLVVGEITKTPLEESKFKVMLELTGPAVSEKDRPGLDLVTVLDVSGSMNTGERLAKMKISMQFVIKKLSPIDRLSVVTFSTNSVRLCPLRKMTENSQTEIVNLVNTLVAEGPTNTTDGLLTGLKVLSDRTITSGRVVGIMLMSNGQQNAGGNNAARVPIGNVPVYTFGFGEDHDPRELKAIADNSMGGTFSDVQNQDNLTIAISQCLAGLLTVAVRDLALTLGQVQGISRIEVLAGNYPVRSQNDDDASSVTVSFGDLYSKEIRKVIVDLLLPDVNQDVVLAAVLRITYSCSQNHLQAQDWDGPVAHSKFITVTRTSTPVEIELMIEETRLQIGQMIKEARVMADEAMLDDAKNRLVEAQNWLEDAVAESNPMIEMLKFELQQLLRRMRSEQIYEMKGRAFALSYETSHDRQRFAVRGGDVKKLRLFSTPHMNVCLEQAKSFDEDPSLPLPTVDEINKRQWISRFRSQSHRQHTR